MDYSFFSDFVSKENYNVTKSKCFISFFLCYLRKIVQVTHYIVFLFPFIKSKIVVVIIIGGKKL